MGRVTFALEIIEKAASFQDRNCPFCGSGNTKLLGRKKFLLELRRCEQCALMFRWPKADEKRGQSYYQCAYHEGETTELPDPATLARIIAQDFPGTHLNYRRRVDAIKQIAPSGHVLDYGASWGYGVRQFIDAGYEAVGFEISEPRAAFGREHLGVTIVGDMVALPSKSFDIVHACHVLEHISDLNKPFTEFRRILKPNGVLVIYVPNAGSERARTLGLKWGPMISESHVLACDAEFFARNLPSFGFTVLFESSPYTNPPRPFQQSLVLDGEELLVIGRLGKVGSD